jgi:hypothetical protein
MDTVEKLEFSRRSQFSKPWAAQQIGDRSARDCCNRLAAAMITASRSSLAVRASVGSHFPSSKKYLRILRGFTASATMAPMASASAVG